MAAPQIEVIAVLKDEQFKAQLKTLASLIKSEIGSGFNQALQTSNVASFQQSIASLTSSVEKLSSSIKNVKVSVKEYQQRQKEAEGSTKATRDAFAQFITSALKGATTSQRFTQQLLQLAVASGANADVVLKLAASSETFSNAQLRAAERVARLQTVIQELSQVANGNEAAMEDLVIASQDLIKAQEDLSKLLKDEAQLIAQKETAQKRLAEIEQKLVGIRAQTFTASLQAITAEQKFTQEILRQVAATGASLPLLQRLATVTGAFSAEEIAAATNVARLTAELEKQARISDRAATENADLEKTARSLIQAQKQLADVQKEQAKAQEQQNREASNADRFFTPLQVAFAKLNNVMAGFRNVVTIVNRTLGELYRTAREGAVIEQTSRSFEDFQNNIVGLPSLLEDLDKAAKGTIATFDLQKEALLLVSGLAPDLARTFSQALVGAGDFETSLIDVARAAQILNPSLGDVDFFLKSLSIGIKRNERRWIDNLGIVISAREAYERFANQTGKNVLELTATDKQLAVLNETLRVGQLLIDQTGNNVTSLIDPFKKLETEVKNLTNDLKVLVAEALLPYVELISGTLTVATEDFSKSQIALASQEAETQEQRMRALRSFVDAANSLKIESPGILSQIFIGELGEDIIGAQFADKQLAQIRDEIIRTSESLEEFSFVFQGVFADQTRQSLEQFLNQIARTEEGREKLNKLGVEVVRIGGVFGLVANQDVPLLKKAVFELANESSETSGTIDELAQASQRAAEAQRLLAQAIDDIADEFLPKQIELVKKLNSNLDELAKNDASAQLARSFREQFVASIQAGFNELFAVEVQEFFGDLAEGTTDAIKEILKFNAEVNKLVKILNENDVSAEVAAGSYLALELGFAKTADQAFAVGKNTQFVQETLIPAAQEAQKTAEEMAMLAEETEKAKEAFGELREALAGIVAGGFDKARESIRAYVEAQRGILANQGELKTVAVDNTKRLAEIDAQLFGDISDERRDELLEQLGDLREAGEEFSAGYAQILDELQNDLSRSERDELLLERFKLGQEQGTLITAIFGRDKSALDKFEEESQNAIQALINNRRETILALFSERGIAFETEIGLLLAFDLIEPDEAQLLLIEQQIFSIIDSLFGAGSVVEAGGVFVDVGALFLQEFTPEQIAELITEIEDQVSKGLLSRGAVSQVVDVVAKLNITGTIEQGDIPSIIQGALNQLSSGATAQEAIAITLSPEFENLEDVQDAREEIEELMRAGDNVPVKLKADVQAFDSIIERLNNINTEIDDIEDREKPAEVEITADGTSFERELARILSIVPDSVTIDINGRDSTRRGGEQEGSGVQTPSEAQGFGGSGGGTTRLPSLQTGGFTGRGNRTQTAGVVEFEEFVFNAPTVDRIGLQNLEDLQSGRAFIANTRASLPSDVVAQMLAAASNPIPSLSPAAANTQISNTRNTSIDNSKTVINNYYERPFSDVIPQPDFFG